MAQWYRSAFGKLANKEIDIDSDALTITLHTATYSPDLSAHAYVSSLSNELSTGGGYTSGGAALTSVSALTTAANSWGYAHSTSTAFTVGKVVRPSSSNGYLYRATSAGTTGASTPSWPTTLGQTVIDGGVIWENVGSAIWVLDGADPSWAAATFTGVRYAVLSDRSTGSTSTQPLLGLVDFGSNQAGQSGAFTITFDPQGILHVFLP